MKENFAKEKRVDKHFVFIHHYALFAQYGIEKPSNISFSLKNIKGGETSLEVKKIDANSKFMFQPANFFVTTLKNLGICKISKCGGKMAL